MIGAAVNVALDYLFIAVFGWGLAGAAFATGLSQALPLVVMLVYFAKPGRRLRFRLRQHNWKEVFQAAYNGISEFINEASGGIVTLIVNWMLIRRVGVDGVAAITVVNYLMFVGFMVFFSVSETIGVMVSQNYGARNAKRIGAFLVTASVTIAVVSAAFIALLLTASEPMILLFVDDRDSADMVAIATDIVTYVWPLFLFAGANMLISGYLTAIQRPSSRAWSPCPAAWSVRRFFLLLGYYLLADYRFRGGATRGRRGDGDSGTGAVLAAFAQEGSGCVAPRSMNRISSRRC